MSRERPLTHERPHTHNPRDPHKVPAREQAHVSPKTNRNASSIGINSSTGISSIGSNSSGGGGGGRVGGDASTTTKDDGRGGVTSRDSCSFPSLPMSLAAWGAPAFGSGLGGSSAAGDGGGGWGGRGGGAGGRGGGKQVGRDVITMAKPRELVAEGLLR